MPAEITQSNEHVAEVRFICDHCRKTVATRLMLKKEAEIQTKKQVICHQCKQNQNPQK